MWGLCRRWPPQAGLVRPPHPAWNSHSPRWMAVPTQTTSSSHEVTQSWGWSPPPPAVTSSSQKLNKEAGSSRLRTSFCAALRLCFSPPHAAGLTTLLWIGALFGKHNSSCLTAEPLNQHSQRPHGPESIEKAQTLVREPSHSEHQSYLTSPRIRIPSGRQRTCCCCRCRCRRCWREESALSAWRRRSMWLNGKWEINFLGRDPWTEGLLKAQRSQSLCRQKNRLY